MKKQLFKEAWRSTPIEDRQRFMSQAMHINHPDFIKAATEIRRRMRRCQNEGTGAGILLLAPSGAGKTHLCRFFKSRWPDEIRKEVTIVPVLRFDIPSPFTERAMARAMLDAMGDPAPHRGNEQDASKRVRMLLPKIGTKLIFIDNVQDLPTKRGVAGIRQIGNWIRSIIEESRVLVVLLGTPLATQIVYANDQLKRRTTKQLHIDYFYIDSPEDYSKFRHFIHRLCATLPLAEQSALPDSLIHEIHFATFGIPDYIFQLFTEAIAVTVEERRECLISEDFAKAFAVVHKDALPKGLNPFLKDGPKRPLTHEGEPFANWFDKSNPSLRPQPTK